MTASHEILTEAEYLQSDTTLRTNKMAYLRALNQINNIEHSDLTALHTTETRLVDVDWGRGTH